MASVQYIGQLRLEIRTHEAAATMSKNQVDRLEYQMSQQTDRIHKLAAVIEEQKTEAEKLNSMNVKQTARVIKLKQRLRELGVDPDTIE
jgi:chromosome segregation ATPase